MKLKTHQKIFLFSILVVAVIAMFDIISMKSGVFGTPVEYLTGNYLPGWWNVFYTFNLMLIILVSLSYYFFGRRDKSETISFGLSSFLLWMYFGLADILFFWLQGVPVVKELPWLMNNPVISRISLALGQTTVTSLTLKISAIIGIVAVYYLTKLLDEKF